jgi:hypothetical protein
VPAAGAAALGLLGLLCIAVVAPRLLFGGAAPAPGTRPAPASPSAPPTTVVPSPTAVPPTPTPSPEPSPIGEVEFTLALAKQRGDSLFVINQGTVDLQLALIRFGNNGDDDDDDRQLSGDEWGIDVLRPGQCVTVWKEEGSPRAPEGIECEIVGERLERSGRDKFWENTFDVYYDDSRVGECNRGDDSCEITFEFFP